MLSCTRPNFAPTRWAIPLSLLLLATVAPAQTPKVGRPAQGGSSGTSSVKGKPPAGIAPPVAPALISELRAYGPAGDDDSFVEVCNTTAQPLSVGGWSLQYLNPKKQLVIAPIRVGLVIPPHGHLLAVGKRYSLKAYAVGDLELADTIASGVRLCDAEGQIVDAVGPQTLGMNTNPTSASTTVLPEVFGEGRGVLLTAFESPTLHAGSKAQFSCVRRHLVDQTTLQDTNNNAADFFVVSVDGALDEDQVRLGAPGPQNMLDSRLDYPLRPQSAKASDTEAKTTAGKSGTAAKTPSPLVKTGVHKDDGVTVHAASTQSGKLPRLRNMTAQGANQRYGTLTLRYRLVNETEQTIKRFSLSVTGITAGDGPPGTADLRLLTPPSVKRLAARGKEAATLTPGKTGVTNVYGILDEPPAQKAGGGLNSSLTFEVPQGIVPGKAVELRFLLGVEAKGHYVVTVDGVGLTATFSGDTETGDGIWKATTRSDEGADQQQFAMNPGQGGRGSNGGTSGGNQGLGGNGMNIKLPPGLDNVQVASIIVVGNTEDETDAPPTKSPLNISISVADSASNVISLRFTGPLDPQSASNTANYSVATQDGAVTVERATYSEGDQSVTLTLAEGSLHRGDMVTVKWSNLRDAQGRVTSGQAGPFKVL